MFAWYEEASGAERRTFWGCFGGWALDAMDVQLYSLVIPTLIAAWGISKTQAGLLATSALLLSAVGGWIAGLLADRIGRVRTLQITILWFAFFTFVSGFAQNFEQLFAARALMARRSLSRGSRDGAMAARTQARSASMPRRINASRSAALVG